MFIEEGMGYEPRFLDEAARGDGEEDFFKESANFVPEGCKIKGHKDDDTKESVEFVPEGRKIRGPHFRTTHWPMETRSDCRRKAHRAKHQQKKERDARRKAEKENKEKVCTSRTRQYPTLPIHDAKDHFKKINKPIFAWILSDKPSLDLLFYEKVINIVFG